MTNAPSYATPGYEDRIEINLNPTKNGRKHARYYSVAETRLVPMPYAEAVKFLALGQADLDVME